MDYAKSRTKTIDSFNYLMNGIARTNNPNLKKTALIFSERFESFIKFTVEFDTLLIENDVLETKANKLELLLSLFLPYWVHEKISESDIMDMKRLQLGNFYAIKSFMEDSSMISEINMLKSVGFRFKPGLNREQLALKVEDCRKKLTKKHASNTKQPQTIDK